MTRISILSLLLTVIFFTLKAQTSISEKTKDFEKKEGYFDYYWDQSTGKVWLEIDKLDTEFLYVNSLAAGIGSNDIGLDRGQLGNTRIVEFRRVGSRFFWYNLIIHIVPIQIILMK